MEAVFKEERRRLISSKQNDKKKIHEKLPTKFLWSPRHYKRTLFVIIKNDNCMQVTWSPIVIMGSGDSMFSVDV